MKYFLVKIHHLKMNGFEGALKADQKTILSVLSKYELTPDQKKQLTEKLKTAK